jgi:hypothetical protein
MLGLLLLVLFVGFLLLLPLMILGLALRLLVGIVVLPFKLAGFALKLTFGLVAGVLALVLGLGIAIVAVLAVGAVLLIPLIPVLLVAGGLWLVWRLARPKSATATLVS